MRKFEKRVNTDTTWVLVEGLDGWHKVRWINDTRIIIQIAGYRGSFQRGHVLSFRNRGGKK